MTPELLLLPEKSRQRRCRYATTSEYATLPTANSRECALRSSFLFAMYIYKFDRPQGRRDTTSCTTTKEKHSDAPLSTYSSNRILGSLRVTCSVFSRLIVRSFPKWQSGKVAKWEKKTSDIPGQAEAARKAGLDATEIECAIGRPRLDPTLPATMPRHQQRGEGSMGKRSAQMEREEEKTLVDLDYSLLKQSQTTSG